MNWAAFLLFTGILPLGVLLLTLLGLAAEKYGEARVTTAVVIVGWLVVAALVGLATT